MATMKAAMRGSTPPRSARWWQRDAEHNERVRRARLQRDSEKPAGRNLEEGSDLVRFAHEFAAAFENARHKD